MLRRRQFGRSSEQLDKQIHQIELQLEELETQAAQTPDVTLPGEQKKEVSQTSSRITLASAARRKTRYPQRPCQ